MTHATKATIKRLQAAAEGREYWSIPATLLRTIGGPKENKYKYCPYCGKEIGVSEDD